VDGFPVLGLLRTLRPIPRSSADSGPARRRPGGAAGRAISGGSHVHHAPIDGVGDQLFPCSLATSTPQAFLVASPPAHDTGFGVAARKSLQSACAAARPISTRSEPVATLRGFNRWFTCVTPFRRCLPDPGRLAVPTRPVVVRAASRPPLRFQGQTALSFTGLLRQTGGGSFHPTRIHGASWRTRARGNRTERPRSPRQAKNGLRAP